MADIFGPYCSAHTCKWGSLVTLQHLRSYLMSLTNSDWKVLRDKAMACFWIHSCMDSGKLCSVGHWFKRAFHKDPLHRVSYGPRRGCQRKEEMMYTRRGRWTNQKVIWRAEANKSMEDKKPFSSFRVIFFFFFIPHNAILRKIPHWWHYIHGHQNA